MSGSRLVAAGAVVAIVVSAVVPAAADSLARTGPWDLAVYAAPLAVTPVASGSERWYWGPTTRMPSTGWDTPLTEPSHHTMVRLSQDGRMVSMAWAEYTSNLDSSVARAVIRTASGVVSTGGISWGPVTVLADDRFASLSGLAVSNDGTHAVALLSTYLYGLGYVLQARAATISGRVATWGPAATVETAPEASGPSLAVSGDGTRATLVWVRSDSVTSAVRTRSAVVGATSLVWGPAQSISPAISPSSLGTVSVAVSVSGSRVTAAWRQGPAGRSVVETRSATVNGTAAAWGRTTTVSLPGASTGSPQVALSDDGTRATLLAVADTSTEKTIVVRSGVISGSSAAWGPKTVVSAAAQAETVPVLALSGTGTRATVVWTRIVQISDSTPVRGDVQARSATISGSAIIWGPTSVVASVPMNGGSAPATVAISRDGSRATAVWGAYDSRLYRGAVWTRSAIVLGTSARWGASYALTPQVPFVTALNVAVSGTGMRTVASWATQWADSFGVFVRSGMPDGTRPTAVMTAPTSWFATSQRVTLSWTASDSGSGVATTAVRWTRAPATGGTWSPWTVPIAWNALTTRSLTATLALGYRYCFQVKARDRAGNVGTWSASRCTTTPSDDRTLIASARWTRGLDPAWLAGTYTFTTASGALLSTSHSVSVRRVGAIATTCSTCGTLAVYVGTTKVGTLTLRSTTARTRVLITLPRLASTRYGTVRLVVVSRGNPVKIDALALSST